VVKLKAILSLFCIVCTRWLRINELLLDGASIPFLGDIAFYIFLDGKTPCFKEQE